jgi:hypothetical protein
MFIHSILSPRNILLVNQQQVQLAVFKDVESQTRHFSIIDLDAGYRVRFS